MRNLHRTAGSFNDCQDSKQTGTLENAGQKEIKAIGISEQVQEVSTVHIHPAF